ncbi:MAG: hypothetical protein LAT64_14740 [Phycisphaerales bacterium]|nr:hypothetical protein [Planctomycetota bacterium]MCH8510006.1 hypothetical protein [Phycisphaerales bacterium]
MKRETCKGCGRKNDKLSPVQSLAMGGCLLIVGIGIYPNWQPTSELVEVGAAKHIFLVGFAITVGGFVIARLLVKQAPSMAGKVMLTIAGVLWMLSGLGVLVHLASLVRGAA